MYDVVYGRSSQEIRDEAALAAAQALQRVTWNEQAERVLKAFTGAEPVVTCLETIERTLRRTADRCSLDACYRAAADLHEAATILYGVSHAARLAQW